MAEPAFCGSFGALQMKPDQKADIPAVRAKGTGAVEKSEPDQAGKPGEAKKGKE